MPGILFRLVFLALLPLASVVSGQSKVVPNTDTVDETLDCAIVGASLSAGFVDGPLTGGEAGNRTVPLQTVLRGWLRDMDGDVKVRSAADLMMFRDPLKKGPQQVQRSVSREPDLVLALDFLFWYAYGRLWLNSQSTEDARLSRLEQGLAHLDSFECPVILGDLPDMTGAAGRMIRPSQIPAPETLKRLNERIRAWAAERPNVYLYPLGNEVAVMKEVGIELPLADGKVQSPPGSMLQGDRLHPNCLGMAWVGFRLQKEVAKALGSTWADKLPSWTLDDFVDLCGADVELELLEGGK